MRVKDSVVTIDYLAKSINEALNEPARVQPQINPNVPDPESATDAEKETMKQFTNAKDNLLKNIKILYAHTAKGFDRYMRNIYSDNYNKAAGERIRQKILADDESWLPKIECLSEEELQGHLRAVDSSSEVIYFDHEFFTGTAKAEGLAMMNYEKALWAALRNELDPQNANNLEGRTFGTINVNGKLTVVEWVCEPKYKEWSES